MITVINIVTDTNIGGAGRYITSFIDNYKKGISLEIFLPENSLLTPEIAKRKVAYTEVPFINDKSFNIRAVSVLLKLFRKKKPDIIHTHAALSARIAGRLYGKCKIIHSRHSVFEPPARQTKFPLKQIYGGINNYLSDIIIAVSPSAADNMIKIGTSREKIKVVYNGVDKIDKLNSEKIVLLRKKYGVTENDFVISICGRLAEIKGHDILLDAAKIIEKTDSSIKFIIAGTGSREAHLRNRANTENIHSIIFAGFVQNIGEILNITNLLVNTSFGTEATSLALLEGMSLGIPAVVSDYGGNPYVILHGVNGYVVPQKNADKLAEAILKIRNDDELYRSMSANSLVVYNEKFTSKKMAENIVRIYSNFKRW